MEPSISVILPVYNSQSSLADTVHRVLDVVPELSAKFEVLIVDDNSTDATEEIACELAATYPQLKVVRTHQREGIEVAGQWAVEHAQGEIVFVHEGESGAPPASQLKELWAMRDDEELRMARCKILAEPMASPTLLSQIARVGGRSKNELCGSVKMIRRRRSHCR